MRDKKARLLAPIYSFLICAFLVLPGEPATPTLTLAFVGDVMLGRGVARELDGDWQSAFADVQPWLAQADLTFANLESPLSPPSSPPWGGTEGGNAYDLRAPPESVVALRAAGFDVVSLANNHALDAGEIGLAQTMAALNAAQIASLPIHQSTHPPTYHLLAFDDSTVPLNVDAASDAVAAAAKRASAVVVSIHWGGEYQAAPGPRQQAIARALSDAGADIIAGHGPHVLQRIEWLGETLVAYSLGNFLFDQPYPIDCRWGVILRVTLQRGRIIAVEAVPTVAERGRVKPAPPDVAAAIYTRIQYSEIVTAQPPAQRRFPTPGLALEPPPARRGFVTPGLALEPTIRLQKISDTPKPPGYKPGWSRLDN